MENKFKNYSANENNPKYIKEKMIYVQNLKEITQDFYTVMHIED